MERFERKDWEFLANRMSEMDDDDVTHRQNEHDIGLSFRTRVFKGSRSQNYALS